MANTAVDVVTYWDRNWRLDNLASTILLKTDAIDAQKGRDEAKEQGGGQEARSGFWAKQAPTLTLVISVVLGKSCCEIKIRHMPVA